TTAHPVVSSGRAHGSADRRTGADRSGVEEPTTRGHSPAGSSNRSTRSPHHIPTAPIGPRVSLHVASSAAPATDSRHPSDLIRVGRLGRRGGCGAGRAPARALGGWDGPAQGWVLTCRPRPSRGPAGV